ncbi:MAG: hypothetical protein WAK11_08945 [Candidatus Cybelea sp.]
MTREDLEASIQAIKRWAQEEIDRLVYAGTKPVSICSTVEAAAREAAIAHANAIVHAAEISEIEAVSDYMSECLNANLHHKERPALPAWLRESTLKRSMVTADGYKS